MALRPDGRSPEALRPITIQRHYTKFAPGSVLIAYGDTQVLCTATVAEEVPPFLRGGDQGWLTAEYRLLPGSTLQRAPRETLKISGRTAEIQRLIGRSLRATLDFTALGPRTISIDADVLQADGGTRTAAITGSFVALYDALLHLKTGGLIATLPLVRQVAAVSVGILDNTAFLDLCYREDVRASVDLNVVMTAGGDFVEIQGTAEGEPFSENQLQAMLILARQGILQLVEVQKNALGEDVLTKQV